MLVKKCNINMFKTVHKTLMMNMDKANQFDQVGVVEGIKRHGSKAIEVVI